MKNVRKIVLLTLLLFIIPFSFSLDQQTYVLCGGDSQTEIFCFGDSQVNSEIGNDGGAPVITITFPDGSDIKALPIPLQLNTDRDSYCNYNIDSGNNLSLFTGDDLNFETTIDSLSNGDHTIEVWCTSSLNGNSTLETVFFYVHITEPGTAPSYSEENIELYNISINYTEPFRFEDTNEIFVYAYNKKGNLVEIEKIQLDFFDDYLGIYDVQRLSLGKYRVDLYIPEYELDEYVFNLNTKKQSVNITEEIKVKMQDDKKKVLKYIPYLFIIGMFLFFMFLLLLLYKKKKKRKVEE